MQKNFADIVNILLPECPICHTIPKIGYACGEYFIYCTANCKSPMCDHSSMEFSIKDWKKFVKDYKEF